MCAYDTEIEMLAQGQLPARACFVQAFGFYRVAVGAKFSKHKRQDLIFLSCVQTLSARFADGWRRHWMIHRLGLVRSSSFSNEVTISCFHWRWKQLLHAHRYQWSFVTFHGDLNTYGDVWPLSRIALVINSGTQFHTEVLRYSSSPI